MIRTLLKESQLVRRRKLLETVTLVLIIVFSSSPAWGHAKLLRSQPEANATLKQPLKIIELWFSEELEQSGSSISVTDQNGKRVDKNNVSLAEEGKKLQVDVEELGSGTYAVEWKALSTDGHMMKGKFTFTMALAANSAASTSTGRGSKGAQQSAQPGSSPPPPQQRPASTSRSTQESGTSWTQSFVRWLQYLAMMMLTGGFAFHVLVLDPSLRRARSLNEDGRAAATSVGARRVILFAWLSLVLLIIVTLAALVLQASTVFDKSIGDALSPGLLNQVITTTVFGASWRLQVWATLALLVIVFYLSRSIKHDKAAGGHRIWWWAGLTACAVLLLAPTWTGHAVIAGKEFPFASLADWLHLLAVGFWVGGLFHLALTMPKAINSILSDVPGGRIYVSGGIHPEEVHKARRIGSSSRDFSRLESSALPV